MRYMPKGQVASEKDRSLDRLRSRKLTLAALLLAVITVLLFVMI